MSISLVTVYLRCAKAADTTAYTHEVRPGEGDMSTEELEKHKHFEEMRKKHYEMKNIKDLLG